MGGSGGEVGVMGRLGSGGWSRVGGVLVGVGGDGIGFEGYQVKGLGSGRSEELGVGVEGVLGRDRLS